MKNIEGKCTHSMTINRTNNYEGGTVKDILMVRVTDGAAELTCTRSETGKDKQVFLIQFELADFSDFSAGIAALCESIVGREME